MELQEALDRIGLGFAPQAALVIAAVGFVLVLLQVTVFGDRALWRRRAGMALDDGRRHDGHGRDGTDHGTRDEDVRADDSGGSA